MGIEVDTQCLHKSSSRHHVFRSKLALWRRRCLKGGGVRTSRGGVPVVIRYSGNMAEAQPLQHPIPQTKPMKPVISRLAQGNWASTVVLEDWALGKVDCSSFTDFYSHSCDYYT